MWLEMSRDEEHGGSGWGFAECLWSPSHKDPTGKWSFWRSLLDVKKDDTVLHLRGKGRKAAFVGYSIADSDGYETRDRPSKPGQWGYAKSFLRVPLTSYIPFFDPIPLSQVFKERDRELRHFFAENRTKPKSSKELIFFVVQENRLQCLNGAYLSKLNSELASIILGPSFGGTRSEYLAGTVSARTDEQVAQLKIRLGQHLFSSNVRSNYGHRCCFPECQVGEDELLVGAHIARWSDAIDLRGQTANGLCLCLFHDRAFELGFFTLTISGRVSVNPDRIRSSPWAKQYVLPYHGRTIAVGPIMPAMEALKQHWSRIGFRPDEALG
jgi:putative restriction endonuclease